MIELIHNPHLWMLFGLYYVFMSAVAALPEPDIASGKVYRFFYIFLHALAGNLKTALASKLPQ